MSSKPIFVATHPRACSTAFERVFMTARNTLQCVHEPFGDAFYFGPERLSDRYENDEKAREESGYAESTFKTIFERIDSETTQDKRVFIKDITHYLVPPDGAPASIAPSLVSYKRGVGTSDAPPNGHSSLDVSTPGPTAASANGVTSNGESKSPPYPYPTEPEPGNPTVVPEALLRQFHFTFLIRHPRSSIPSYYRCTVPPLDEVTGFYDFKPSEAGYRELRLVFDYLKDNGLIGPGLAGRSSATDGANGTANGLHGPSMNGHQSDCTNGINGTNGEHETQDKVEICVVDADDLLDSPALMIEAYCKSVGIKYSPDMLKWDSEEDHRLAKQAFEKWKGFHEDAIDSTELRPRTTKKAPKSDEQCYQEWVEKFGEKGAKIVKATVDANVQDYEYLKQFAIKV